MPLPASLTPPIGVALARLASQLPRPGALPGGSIYEPKWDGYRMVVRRDGGDVSLWSRQGKDLTATFPELSAAALEQLPDGCVLDGEAVVWEAGRLSFDALQQRIGAGTARTARVARERPASFAAFDLLGVADRDVRHVALADRRTLLEQLASDWIPPLHLSPATRDVDEARTWLRDMTASGIEGLVIKGASQRYQPGKREWLKVKHRDVVDVIVGAVIGPMTAPEEVVVGLPIGGELRIVGRSTPLKPVTSRRLAPHLRPPVGAHPWPEWVKAGTLDRFNGRGELVHLTLVEPLVAEVSADVAWSGQSFRHAVRFLRSRPELDTADVAEHQQPSRDESVER